MEGKGRVSSSLSDGRGDQSTEEASSERKPAHNDIVETSSEDQKKRVGWGSVDDGWKVKNKNRTGTRKRRPRASGELTSLGAFLCSPQSTRKSFPRVPDT